MVRIFKDHSNTDKFQVRIIYSFTLMAPIKEAVLSIERSKVKEYSYPRMVILHMRENGKIINPMGKVKRFILMDLFMKDNLLMV